jgi:uncharacterized protein
VTLRRSVGTALFAVGLACCQLSAAVAAVEEVAVPPLVARVTDQTGTLSAEQKATLERTLSEFETRKGSQIAIVLVPTTAPEAIEQFAIRVAEQWKIGRQRIDDGAILVVAKADRTLRIEVGYGLEGVLNDATSQRIISETIIPRFRQGDFYGGLAAGVARMIAVVDGEALPPPQPRRSAAAVGDFEAYLPIVLIAALLLGGLLRAALGRFVGAVFTGGAVGVLVWFLVGAVAVAVLAGVIATVYTLFGGGRGFGGFPGGFGGRGGSGGLGGFGGGGGGFGGGGASGRW